MKIRDIVLPVTLMYLLYLSCSAYAIQGSYNFLALNYGLMWSQYASTVEGKAAGDKNCPVNLCLGLDGYCKNRVYCGIFEITTRITVPEDLNLVTSDGYVVGDEVCVGDEFKLDKGLIKGEDWDDGGDQDSPAIYWIDDVESAVKKIVSQHETSSPARIGGTQVDDGYVDPLSGVAVYTRIIPASSAVYNVSGNYKIIGNIACSVKGSASANGEIMQDGDYYKATAPGTASFNANYVVECMYYYYGGACNPSDDMCSATSATNTFCQYQVPMFPHLTGSSLKDLLSVGTISLNKNLKITTSSTPKVGFSITGAESIKLGEENNLRILVKNTGDTNITVTDIYSTAPHKYISCDNPTIAPGTESECIMSVTPTVGTGLDVTILYEYSSCGKEETGQITKIVLGSESLTPSAAYQVYGTDVKGDCKNSYYSCDTPSDSLLSVGYRCEKEQSYNTPTAGRADLQFDLSTLDPTASIAAANLKITPSLVTTPQKIGVYVLNSALTPASCSPGGDICTQPYCMECQPLYAILGDAIATQDVSAIQPYSFDVTEYVKSAVASGNKVISFQLRGVENLWDTQGGTQCDSDGYWTKQDVSIPASGADGPVLEIVLK